MELLLLLSGVFEIALLILLFLLSIWSIAIMIDRRRALKKALSDVDYNELKIAILQKRWTDLNRSDSSVVHYLLNYLAQQNSHNYDTLERLYKSEASEKRLTLERGLSVLATLGANAPFIGLLGTVLGIIKAFSALGTDEVGASSVMSGISIALFATAAGLFVAIPAVIAFNYFSRRIREIMMNTDRLADLIIAAKSKE